MAKATHVLVVEDEAALADLLKYNLEKEGYRVSVANVTAAPALKYAAVCARAKTRATHRS
jgi:DNA-binding response OmpR family regulator